MDIIQDNKGRKLRRVEVPTPNGTKKITYGFGQNGGKADNEEINVCATDCTYYNLCRWLPDPEHQDDFENWRFCDFCTRKGDEAETEEEREIRRMVPLPGELENVLGENGVPRVLSVIAKKNPIVYLNDVIDNVCDKICDMYDPEHSSCGCNNPMCILQDLFPKTIKPKNLKVLKLPEKLSKDGGRLDRTIIEETDD